MSPPQVWAVCLPSTPSPSAPVLRWRAEMRGAPPVAEATPAAAGPHWMLLPLLLGLPLASVPLVSEDRALFRELRLASEGSVSRRGGIRSLMRSRPLASAKLVILCWGEKPLMAVEMQEKGGWRKSGVVLKKRQTRQLKEWGHTCSHSPTRHWINFGLSSWNNFYWENYKIEFFWGAFGQFNHEEWATEGGACEHCNNNCMIMVHRDLQRNGLTFMHLTLIHFLNQRTRQQPLSIDIKMKGKHVA